MPGITVNRNAVPNDPRPPMVTSGSRIGNSALATRGFDAEASPRWLTSSPPVLLPNLDTRPCALAWMHSAPSTPSTRAARTGRTGNDPVRSSARVADAGGGYFRPPPAVPDPLYR